MMLESIGRRAQVVTETPQGCWSNKVALTGYAIASCLNMVAVPVLTSVANDQAHLGMGLGERNWVALGFGTGTQLVISVIFYLTFRR